jgi:hypothetical protein
MNNDYVLEDLLSCPICQEDCAYIESEGDFCVYVICGHCGSRSVTADYSTPEERVRAEMQVTHLWNIGKVVRGDIGE